MPYSEVVVLIPSHSLEDFPTELGDDPAAGLLNSFSVAWHPELLVSAQNVPVWHRADEPPDQFENRLYFVPSACDDQIPHGWCERAESEGAVVVHGSADRPQMIEAALAPLRTPQTVDEQTDATKQSKDEQQSVDESESVSDEDAPDSPGLDEDLVQDFLALGTCWILLELLTRHMHHFNSYDELYLEKTAVEAAGKMSDGLLDEARTQLQSCFDVLMEARERFFPVDCYLLDFCLLAPDMAGDALDEMLEGELPVNYLLKASDAEALAEASPETVEKLKQAWKAETADVVGGDYEEFPVPLVPLETVLRDLDKGRSVFRKLFNRQPTTWGRRRYGLSVMTPQLLQNSGFDSALHYLLDDGIYPDREQSRMRWEGCDSSTVDAYSRIPLAADSSTTWLRFPQRMAETMESDQVAALILARWPDISSPFFRDIQRIQAYAPVLGRFVTFSEYFLHTDDTGGYWGHEDKHYLSPFFLQAVARRESHPISRFSNFISKMGEFESAAWNGAISNALMQKPVDDESAGITQDILEQAGPDSFEDGDESAGEKAESATTALKDFSEKTRSSIAQIIMHGAGDQPGWLCVNPLSFSRRVVVDFPDDIGAIKDEAPVRAVQCDGQRNQALIDIPAAGYAWIPESNTAATPSAGGALAEKNHIQNELFEVFISESTGGIRSVKKHGRNPVRLSQQLAFRFPRELTVRKQVEGEIEEDKTWYSEMRCHSAEVISSGPSVGEIVTTGDLVDPSTDTRVSGFRQTVRIWRGLPYIELEIELEPERVPEGDPWSNFYSSRFAWNDSTASLSQSILGAAQPVQMERIESTDFVEIAYSEEERTTILPLGRPFHRKSGSRMLDSLLIVEGESQRTFRFIIAIDQHYPMQTARDCMTPIIPIRTTGGPPRAGNTGWFYHVDARCIQVTRILALKAEPYHSVDSDAEQIPEQETPSGPGFAMRVQETEGRYQSVHIEFFKAPNSARLRDFCGKTIREVSIEGDGVRFEVSPFQLVDLEVRFD